MNLCADLCVDLSVGTKCPPTIIAGRVIKNESVYRWYDATATCLYSRTSLYMHAFTR